MPIIRIVDNKVVTEEERFSITSFAAVVGVYRSTVDYWIRQGKIDLDQLPYDVILQFWNMQTECTECGRRTDPGIGNERWCPHCGEARLKIGITYYHDHINGDDLDNDGVTWQTPFRTTSKAMCRSRYLYDRIVNLRRRRGSDS